METHFYVSLSKDVYGFEKLYTYCFVYHSSGKTEKIISYLGKPIRLTTFNVKEITHSGPKVINNALII